jgi:hypothetical protein
VVDRPGAATADPDVEAAAGVDLGGRSALGWLLVAVACALVLGAGAYAAIRLRPRAAPEPAASAADDGVPRVEAALRLLRDATGDDARLALDALAEALAEEGDRGLAADAERLAWSRTGPEPRRVDTLVGAVSRRRAP